MLRVVERMDVQNLWMHQPWNHGDLARLFRHGRVTDESVTATLRRDLDAAKAVETEALRRRIPIVEPFTNNAIFEDLVYVVGPTLEFYEAQIAHFSCTPAPAAPPPRIGLRIAGTPPRQDWTSETLDHTCDTSAENNTSVILAVKFADDYWGMLTGDAGDTALTGALNQLAVANFNTNRFKFVQIPHHGSEHNISPAILNRWLGTRRSAGPAHEDGVRLVGCRRAEAPVRQGDERVPSAWRVAVRDRGTGDSPRQRKRSCSRRLDQPRPVSLLPGSGVSGHLEARGRVHGAGSASAGSADRAAVRRQRLRLGPRQPARLERPGRSVRRLRRHDPAVVRRPRPRQGRREEAVQEMGRPAD